MKTKVFISLSLYAREYQVANRVAQPPPALLELGRRARDESRVAGSKAGVRLENGGNVLGILRPVRRHVHDATRHELSRDQRYERRLHEPPLVVALLRPRVGKEDVQCGERAIADHPLEDLDGVMADDTKIGELA